MEATTTGACYDTRRTTDNIASDCDSERICVGRRRMCREPEDWSRLHDRAHRSAHMLEAERVTQFVCDYNSQIERTASLECQKTRIEDVVVVLSIQKDCPTLYLRQCNNRCVGHGEGDASASVQADDQRGVLATIHLHGLWRLE